MNKKTNQQLNKRINLTMKQKLNYGKVMVENNLSRKTMMDITGTSTASVGRMKKLYLDSISNQPAMKKPTVVARERENKVLNKRIKALDQQLIKTNNKLADAQKHFKLLQTLYVVSINEHVPA